MHQNANPASAGTLGGADCDAQRYRNTYKLFGAKNKPPIKPRHLRISRLGPAKYVPHRYVLVLIDSADRKRLGTFRSRREAVAAASRFCRQLHVTVRGRWSAFYRKIKRAEFEERQHRIAARQRKNKISIVKEFELSSRQIARLS